eukprot:Phypoly_transcript_12121.p1 GENE.Phypoly_transcript_12121~~Phypoly_transcript_12121.p1  ORF type:complete len:292 (+),score=48.90 Phypoly_transcript_12121:208-1083(+)
MAQLVVDTPNDITLGALNSEQKPQKLIGCCHSGVVRTAAHHGVATWGCKLENAANNLKIEVFVNNKVRIFAGFTVETSDSVAVQDVILSFTQGFVELQDHMEHPILPIVEYNAPHPAIPQTLPQTLSAQVPPCHPSPCLPSQPIARTSSLIACSSPYYLSSQPSSHQPSYGQPSHQPPPTPQYLANPTSSFIAAAPYQPALANAPMPVGPVGPVRPVGPVGPPVQALLEYILYQQVPALIHPHPFLNVLSAQSAQDISALPLNDPHTLTQITRRIAQELGDNNLMNIMGRF